MRRLRSCLFVVAVGISFTGCERTPVDPDESAGPQAGTSPPAITPPGPAPGNPSGQKNPIPFIWSASEGIEQIPLPEGALYGVASAINNRGEVIGWYQPAGAIQRAFIWSRERGFRALPETLQGGNVWASDINDLGQVTGFVSFAWDAGISFVWAEGQGMTIVAIPDADIMANAINNKGEVAGQKIYQYGNPNSPSVAHEAFVWHPTGGFRSVAGSGQFRYATAMDINDAGEAVGLDAGEWQRSPRPVVWAPGLSNPVALAARVDYDDCSGWWSQEAGTGTCGEATAINSRGDAAGSANGRAFRTRRGHELSYLSLSEGRASFASAINDDGDVAGYTVSHPGFGSIIAAFVWRQDGTVVRLGILPGATSTYASDMNEHGQVVGYAR